MLQSSVINHIEMCIIILGADNHFSYVSNAKLNTLISIHCTNLFVIPYKNKRNSPVPYNESNNYFNNIQMIKINMFNCMTTSLIDCLLYPVLSYLLNCLFYSIIFRHFTMKNMQFDTV